MACRKVFLNCILVLDPLVRETHWEKMKVSGVGKRKRTKKFCLLEQGNSLRLCFN